MALLLAELDPPAAQYTTDEEDNTVDSIHAQYMVRSTWYF